MGERSIIFNSEMVRAILEGRKTQTRRVLKPQPDHFGLHNCNKYPLSTLDIEGGWYGDFDGETKIINCPYGKVGDRLWVRETWQYNPYGGIVYQAGSGIVDCDGRGWRSSIHMPRWASRITLEIMNIRVEKLHHITTADAVSEGTDNKTTFETLWNSINEKRGYGWDKNPWVWVIKFKKDK